MPRGGGLRVAQKSVRRVSSRTHIRRVLTVSIVTVTFVHYAYSNRKLMIRFVPLVAVND